MLKNKLCVPVHFVWATWDRQPLITGDMERRLYRYLAAACEDAKCKVLTVGGMPDHVHLLTLLSNTVTLGQLMKRVKGGSSHFVSQTLRPGEWFAWQGTYGASGVSRSAIKTVVHYIDNQKRHHAAGTCWPEAEETYEIVDEPD